MSSEIRECTTIAEFTECVSLQREVFGLPDSELSPVRHFVVTMNAGGWTLGEFDGGRLLGFVLSVPAFVPAGRGFYSHMAAVRTDAQGSGVGARLKWAQRARALADGVSYIKWTFEPMRARNAYFNLEKLGVVVRRYRENFYGTDYAAPAETRVAAGLESDRLVAEWHLEDEKVVGLGEGREPAAHNEADVTITIPADWPETLRSDRARAIDLQLRVRDEFGEAFNRGLACRGFDRDAPAGPRYLLYSE
jgi:predicted GNAT superfamily acetyltransferase